MSKNTPMNPLSFEGKRPVAIRIPLVHPMFLNVRLEVMSHED